MKRLSFAGTPKQPGLAPGKIQTGQTGAKRRRSLLPVCWLLAFGFAWIPQARAGFIFDFAQNGFTLKNTNADGSVIQQNNEITLTGGNNGSGLPGTTDFVANATGSGVIQFQFSYASADTPTFDFAGYLLNNNFSVLADTGGQAGTGMFPVSVGDSFGFRVGTADNTGEPGILTVTGVSTTVPEPGTAPILFLLTAGAMIAKRWRGRTKRDPVTEGRKGFGLIMLGTGVLAGSSLLAQSQFHYTGTNVTGQLVLSGTVNLVQQTRTLASRTAMIAGPEVDMDMALNTTTGLNTKEVYPEVTPKMPPELFPPLPLAPPSPTKAFRTFAAVQMPRMQSLAMQSLAVNPGSGSFGFSGLTHFDQRNANKGNQFSIEPPSPSLAVGNGFLLEGVNNAIQVYSLSGTPLLPAVLSSNQVFGLPPAINRTTGVNGVFPTDMRVFHDQGINRWFVLQRAQGNDAAGNSLPQSKVYIAVSQTGDPTGTYNVYLIDTTNPQRTGCPCLSDYPQIGADQYGFYISSVEYSLSPSGNPSQFPLGATILAISKASLASGANSPTTYKFELPSKTGFEFAIQPATTPPGSSYFMANGGLEYFVSSIATGDSNLAFWAMSNTSSLATANPNPALTRITVPALSYGPPGNAIQPTGPLPYGSTLSPPGLVPLLDGSDSRVLSLIYSGGRLYATLGTQVVDEDGHALAGGAYVIFSPTFRGGALGGAVLRQDYLLVKNNNLLRPAIGVNSQGRGAIVFTLVGRDYYPSAAFVPVDTFSTGSTVQIAGRGLLPEDGFTGYPSQGTARWGDYSAAVADSDGSIWMATEYIPNMPRTQFANWGTFLIMYMP